jgi:hypothetical protein
MNYIDNYKLIKYSLKIITTCSKLKNKDIDNRFRDYKNL